MKIKIHYILLAFVLTLSLIACKTKQEVVQESQFQDELDARAAEAKMLYDQSGLDPETAEKLAESMQSLDAELMNFLATDPDADARRATLKKLMAQRNSKLKSTMSDEQYSKYLDALRRQAEIKSKTIGAPAKDSGK